MRTTLFITLLIGSLAMAVAGNKPLKVDPAVEFMQNGQVTEAIQWLEAEYLRLPTPALAGRLAEACLLNKQYVRALQWVDKIGNLETTDSSRYLVTKGDALLGAGLYDEAMSAYTLYSGMVGSSDKVLDRIAAVNQLKTVREQSELWQVDDLPFNTDRDEWFVTNFRTRELMISNHLAPSAGDLHFDFFTLEREYDKWLSPKPLMRPEDETHNRIGISFAKDGNTVYYVQVDRVEAAPQPVPTKGKTTKPVDGMYEIKHTLYKANILGNRLSDIEALSLVPAGSLIKDPCIDATGTILYFSSNMPGGMGGYDIYLSRYVKDKWLTPENLGPTVNSTADDIAPYVRQDNFESTLYFASDRSFGFGGLDLYQAKHDGKRWLKAEILPPPVNSAGDERSIMFDPKKMSGYITSNRSGGKGSFDVYRFRPFALTLAVKVESEKQPLGFALGKLNEAESISNPDGMIYFPVQPGKNYALQVSSSGFKESVQAVSIAQAEQRDTIPVSVSMTLLPVAPVVAPAPVAAPAPVKTPTATAPPVQPAAPVQSASSSSPYVDLSILVKDGQNAIMPGYIFTLINLQNSKVKLIQAGPDGMIDQVLMPGNDYRLVANEKNYAISEKISTRNAKPGSAIKYLIQLTDTNYTLSPLTGTN